jgi:GNAT superfamily N-acetyltransferase
VLSSSAIHVPDKLLERYDIEERRDAAEVGMRREVGANVVRLLEVDGTFGTVLYSTLGESNADQVIDEERAYFADLGYELEWKAFSHDLPMDLVQRLRAHGFQIDEPEAIVVLDLDRAHPRLFEPTPDVRKLSNPDEVRRILAIFRDDRPAYVERLARELSASQGALSIYITEVDGQPGAYGSVRFPPARSFASLWGGTTLPALRNRGLYSQLVSARVQEARKRGYRYVTVDARSTSRPILERRGFRILTWATACTRPAPARDA